MGNGVMISLELSLKMYVPNGLDADQLIWIAVYIPSLTKM